MIPLRPLFSTLAFFNACELFQFSMQSFYRPTHLVLFLNNLRLDRALGTIRNHPVNVAVRGDYLEKLHFKRTRLPTISNLLLRYEFSSGGRSVT